ncbi:hypothetical protein MFIFM68171_09511 [Madurella fahalii]|uniref:Uncharacterized protein n=1 Tax=Madurella fahalii TaxID=1157608 RepID=A0ABQ0GNK8_9PEZI
MPSIISYLARKYRRASSSSHSYDVDSNRSKLKKRSGFLSTDGSRFREFMRSNASFQSILKPSRPHRTSTTDVPDLPSLPIYQTFTAKTSPDGVIPGVLPQITLQRANESQQTALSHTTAVATTAVDQPPAYDRATELAEVYRAVLPEFDNMGSSRVPSRRGVHRRAHSRASQKPDIARHTPRASTWTNSIIAPSLASSTTAVELESDGRSSGAAQPPATSIPVIPPRSPIRTSQPPAVSMPTLRGSLAATAAATTAATGRFASPGPRSPCQPSPASQSRASEFCYPLPPSRLGHGASNSISLQICAQLLADELTKVLSPRQNHTPEEHRAAKLQVLLLIESYEGVLENCRREMARKESEGNSGGSGGGGDGGGEHGEESEDEKVAHVREAMGILEHWLDML